MIIFYINQWISFFLNSNYFIKIEWLFLGEPYKCHIKKIIINMKNYASKNYNNENECEKI